MSTRDEIAELLESNQCCEEDIGATIIADALLRRFPQLEESKYISVERERVRDLVINSCPECFARQGFKFCEYHKRYFEASDSCVPKAKWCDVERILVISKKGRNV